MDGVANLRAEDVTGANLGVGMGCRYPGDVRRESYTFGLEGPA